MRVAIAKKLLSSVGGSELLARLLARALVQRGHTVTLIGMRPAWPRPGIPEEAWSGRSGVVANDDAVRTVYLPVRLGRFGAMIDGLLPTSLVKDDDLAEHLRGVDVIHSIAREWALPLERVARKVRAAFVETPLTHPGQPFSGGGRADVARYRRDDAVIALTEWEASWYRARGVPRVHVTGVGPGGNDPADADPDPATILFVGRKERYKGYHALRRAADLVWQVRPDARFVAIGQRSWRDALAVARTDPRWTDLGVVDDPTRALAYARATVLAMPSEHETFGMTYLEAWASGRPVIAGDIPPLREVVREGIDGLHVRNEPAAIARAILRILADPEEARRMGLAGQARLRAKWTWPLVAEATERAYLAALERGRSLR